MRILSAALGLTLALSVSGAEMRFNFGQFSEGASPTNFHSVLFGKGQPGKWIIQMDAVPSAFAPLTDKAPSVTKRGVMAQLSQDPTDERYPILLLNQEIFRNFKFITQIKMVSGMTEQMAGLVFRFQNASNFYVVRASALGKNVRFYKVVNGIRADPIGPNVEINAGEWHALSVKCEGNQISISLDDKLVMPPLVDNTFIEGKIGFWTKSDSASYFADALVDYTPRIPNAQAMVNSVAAKQSRLLGLRVYTLEADGSTRVIASKDETEIGQPGTAAELQAIQDRTVSFGRDKNAVLVTLPMHDRNGEIIAAVRVKMKSFLGETQNNAVTRATTILQYLQQYCTSAEDLRK